MPGHGGNLATRHLMRVANAPKSAGAASSSAAQSVTAAALTIDAHMAKLEELRDDAQQRGQLSAAIQAEVKRGELRRFYVKQVETGDAGDFSRMSDEELLAYVEGTSVPPKGETKH
jgi:hypothetical protein